MTRVSFSQWIKEGKDLPVLSSTVARILTLTQGDNSRVDEVAEIIKKDVSLSAAVIKISNSPAFGLTKKISSIDQAVIMLGFTALRNIALGVSVLNLLPPDEGGFLSKTWKRSLVTAIAARELGRLGKYKKIDDAFTVGLLHDIGFIALYRYDRKAVSDVANLTEKNGRMSLEEERKYSGIDHVEAGRILAKHWCLPDELASAIASHHEEPQIAPSENGKLAQLSYLGSLVGDIFFFGNKRENIEQFHEGAAKFMNVSIEDADTLLQDMHQRLVEIASYFNIGVGRETSYDEMIRKTNEEIVNVTISNEAIKYHLSQAFAREKSLAAQLEEANRKLKIMAAKDGLTGLYNRQSFNELIAKEWSRSERYAYPLSLIMIDIDNFKQVNDTHGHQAGDLALKEVATALEKMARKGDCVARYGGEEFVIIMPQTDLTNAFQAAERIRTGIQQLVILLEKDIHLSLTVSCGVAAANPSRNGNLEVLLQEADQALYQAKWAGRNRVFLLGEDSDLPIREMAN